MPRQPKRKSSSQGNGGIQVIRRAGQILRALAGTRTGLSLAEIADRVDLPRSTVHRIITALETEGLVSAASPNARFRLGPELVRMASTEHGDLRGEIRPFLEELSHRVDETVDLAVLSRDQVSFIDQIPAPHRLRAVSAVGASFPAHCTANGKALLATMTDDALRKLLPARLKAFTENTITDRKKLLEELAEVRRLGYAEDREEHSLWISAVGGALSDVYGPVAAISIPVPTQRFGERRGALVDALLDTCERASKHLGAPDRDALATAGDGRST